MRRARVLLLPLAATLVLFPGALGALTFPVVSPAPAAPFSPQMGCEIVYETAGAQRCDVFAPVRNANELRITLGGLASHVFVLVDDVRNGVSHPIQLTWADCRSGCVRSFAMTTSPMVALYVTSEGQRGSVVSVTIHSGLGQSLA